MPLCTPTDVMSVWSTCENTVAQVGLELHQHVAFQFYCALGLSMRCPIGLAVYAISLLQLEVIPPVKCI